MELSALLTSAGINIGICVLLFSVYSILRKQPGNRHVYFGRKLAQIRSKRYHDPHWFERFVPSASWIVKAWETPEEDILAAGGLDAVVFVRALVFSIRIFAVAAIVCTFIVLPLNYYGQELQHERVPLESVEVFTTQNIPERSKWLWAHCLSLYVICCSACILLYFEYKNIIKRRLEYIKGSSSNLSRFAVVVRGIPWSAEESYSESLKRYFTKTYASSYLSHQMVYHNGQIQKLMKKAAEMYDVIYHHDIQPSCASCGFPGGRSNAFNILFSEPEEAKKGKFDIHSYDLRAKGKECPAAFVFFKTRYAAACAALTLQSSNPMLWVTNLAPEPRDVYWPNLSIPYRQFWLRRTATVLATAAFLVFFIGAVTLVQGLANLQQLPRMFPFLSGLLKKIYIRQLVTGYLPSVILICFFYTVGPLMILFSTVEGSISRSERKLAACTKSVYFTIWNVFFVNIASGTVLNKLDVFSTPKNLPTQLAAGAVPAAVKFFMTYVLTSGWNSLSCELVQLYPFFWNFVCKFILRRKGAPFEEGFTFPYHTELPRVLLFGLLGFTFAILAPLILPLLLIYFCLAYLVYRNQILNVYITDYDSGGQYWPIIHNTTIFSLVLSQVIALGVFASKQSTVCLAFTIVLITCTLLFNEYCRQRFHPVFRNIASEVLIEMDQQDEQSGRMDEIYQQLESAYCQLKWISYDSFKLRLPNEDCTRQIELETKRGDEYVLENKDENDCSRVNRLREFIQENLEENESNQVKKSLDVDHSTEKEPKL